jgi:hypothetical protein
MHRRPVVAVAALTSLVLAACGSSAQPAPSPSVIDSSASGDVASAARTGFVGWDVVRPETVEEGSFVSNGDEPFLAVLLIKSTTGVAGSTKWAWVTDDPQESGSVDEGKELRINDTTGDAWFTGYLAVRPLEETQLIGMDTNLTADIMVTVAFVFEADAGDRAQDVRILKSLTDPIVKQVARIVEGAKIPLGVQTAIDPVKTTKPLKDLANTAAKINAPEITSEMIFSLLGRVVAASGDPNDVIGVATTAFIPSTGALLSTLERVGITPSTIGLLNAGQGDGNQAWTNYKTWNYPFDVPVLGRGSINGEVWYGFLTDRWVEDWMVVESSLPWQTRVKYWLKVTASMRA